MANLNRTWRKFVWISDTHGHLIDWESTGEVLNFVDRYKPYSRFHGGDYVDTVAFRAGAKGTPDEAASCSLDLNEGLRLLELYRPTHLINGNHDDRLWEAARSNSAIRAHAAQSLINDIEKLVRKLKCQHHTEYDQHNPGIVVADMLLMHGFMFNQMAIRDHAETYCMKAPKILFGHTHAPGIATGRQLGSPIAYNAGFLGDRAKFKYANRNRNKHAWGQAIIFGEYCDNDSMIWLVEKPKVGGWRFPL